MLQSFASAAATVQCSSGGGCTTHHRRLQHNAAVAGAAAQRRRGRRRVVAQHACKKIQHAAPVCGPTSRRLKIHGQGWPGGGAGGDRGAWAGE